MSNQHIQAGAEAVSRHGVAWGWVALSLGIQAGAMVPLFLCEVYVVPKFTYIFKDLGTALPMLTQAVIQAGRILGNVLVLLPLLDCPCSRCSSWRRWGWARAGSTRGCCGAGRRRSLRCRRSPRQP